MSIKVTLLSNVQLDLDGNPANDKNGNFILIDDEDIGLLKKTHTILTISLTEKPAAFAASTQEFDSGYTTRCEVYWDKRRNPSPAMIKPSELFWLEVMDDQLEEYDEDEDEDEQEHDDSENVVEIDA